MRRPYHGTDAAATNGGLKFAVHLFDGAGRVEALSQQDDAIEEEERGNAVDNVLQNLNAAQKTRQHRRKSLFQQLWNRPWDRAVHCIMHRLKPQQMCVALKSKAINPCFSTTTESVMNQKISIVLQQGSNGYKLIFSDILLTLVLFCPCTCSHIYKHVSRWR